MGQGEELKIRPDPKVEIQERGEIFFFYRPKVGREEAHSADDVRRLYIVLCPESGERPVEVKQASDSGKEGEKITQGNKEEGTTLQGEKKKKRKKADQEHSGSEGGQGKKKLAQEHSGSEGGHGIEEVNIEKQPLFRLIVMGHKGLPDPHKKGQPYWGFVEMVTTKVDDIKIAFKGEEYDTATRGHRHVPPARALAEGIYRILRHQPSGSKKPQTHLIYKLEYPPANKMHDPQKSLHIEREESLLLQIKNPEKGSSSFRGLEAKRKPVFPAGLRGRLGQYRFAPADPPDFLNYEGCEFLLIAASDDLDEELGLELRTAAEEVRGDKSCSDLIQMFGEVGSCKPLLSGTWV